jgi:hypothetical protein
MDWMTGAENRDDDFAMVPSVLHTESKSAIVCEHGHPRRVSPSLSLSLDSALSNTPSAVRLKRILSAIKEAYILQVECFERQAAHADITQSGATCGGLGLDRRLV